MVQLYIYILFHILFHYGLLQDREFLGWHRGYLLFPDLLLWSLLLPNLYHFGYYRKNNYKKIHPSTSLLLRWINIFPPVSGGPWVSYSLLGRDFSLPSKSWSYCSPDSRCFKALSWQQTIFTSHEAKQLLNRRDHLWMSDQGILRYQVVLMENPGLTICPCEVFNPATHLPTPKGSLSFHSCL